MTPVTGDPEQRSQRPRHRKSDDRPLMDVDASALVFPDTPLNRHLREWVARPARRTDLRIPFGDGVYRLALGSRQIAELEQICGFTDKHGNQHSLGIGAIFSRLAKGRAFLPGGSLDWENIGIAQSLASEVVSRDCTAAIRLGLVGGGEGHVEGETIAVGDGTVQRLMQTYVEGRPLEYAWTIAFALLGAAIHGRDADPETGL